MWQILANSVAVFVAENKKPPDNQEVLNLLEQSGKVRINGQTLLIISVIQAKIYSLGIVQTRKRGLQSCSFSDLHS